MATLVSSSTTHEPYTHTVAVGKAGYTFQPDVVLAEVGDYIEYAFYPVNHSVIQAAYGYPCVPYGLVNTRPGFASPFHPVDAVLDDPPTFTVRVNDTDPFFVYCSGPWACIDHGMVAVVNPNANVSLESQRQMALEAGFVLQPGDKWPEEGRSTSTSVYATATPTIQATVTLTPTSTPSPTTGSTSETSATPTPVASASQGLSTGAIAGIAIGAALVLLLAGITVWVCGRRSNRGNGNGNTNDNTNGAWYLGNRKDNFSYRNSKATQSMPPAYNNPHGMPAMTQQQMKGYPNANIVEHSNLSPSGSPPPQISPHYAQQNFPPHIMDPAYNYNNNAAYLPMPAQGQPGHPPHHYQHPNQQQFMPQPPPERTEIYTATPAPRNIPTTTSADHTRTSMSLSAHSRGGSPDILAEMNAARSQAGTMNHAGGGGGLQQPVPIRGQGVGGGLGRFDL